MDFLLKFIFLAKILRENAVFPTIKGPKNLQGTNIIIFYFVNIRHQKVPQN